jgi:hypothetical protein
VHVRGAAGPDRGGVRRARVLLPAAAISSPSSA